MAKVFMRIARIVFEQIRERGDDRPNDDVSVGEVERNGVLKSGSVMLR